MRPPADWRQMQSRGLHGVVAARFLRAAVNLDVGTSKALGAAPGGRGAYAVVLLPAPSHAAAAEAPGAGGRRLFPEPDRPDPRLHPRAGLPRRAHPAAARHPSDPETGAG